MAAVRQIINSSMLNHVVPLPEHMQNIQVEIVITAIQQNHTKRLMTQEQLLAQLNGSHTQALSGVISADNDFSLDELRAERRRKYEHFG